MDKECRVSIETISAHFDVSVGTLLTIILEELKIWKICTKFSQGCSEKIRKKDVVHDRREMVELINSDPAVFDALVTGDEAGSTAMTQRPRDRVHSGSMLALPDLRRPDRENPHTNF